MGDDVGNRIVVRPPSFPEVNAGEVLSADPGREWQVLCGDCGHWRLGIYSPPFSSRQELTRLERHSCPELFLLLSGEIVLVVAEMSSGGPELREIPLALGKPVLITQPHAGYCPCGRHTGTAVVVERDEFETHYLPLSGWPSVLAGSRPAANGSAAKNCETGDKTD